MQISTISVVGAGTMGSGIAQVAAIKGLDVILVDVNEAAVAKGTNAIESRLARLVASGQMSAAEKAAALGRIHGAADYQDLKPANVIIEAAVEDYDLKAKILKQIDKLVRGDAIIASNTSSISITRLASLISHPERFVGMHFFNPVPVMALVEIVRGLQTSDATHDAVATLATRLGKSSISVKSAPGIRRQSNPAADDQRSVLRSR